MFDLSICVPKAMAVAYARAFVSATNKTSLGDVSDLPLDPSLLDMDAIASLGSMVVCMFVDVSGEDNQLILVDNW